MPFLNQSRISEYSYLLGGIILSILAIQSKKIQNQLQANKFIVIVAIVLGLVAAILAVAMPTFYTSANIQSLLAQCSAIALMAFGQTFVMVSGGVDLGTPSVMCMSAVVGTLVMRSYGVFFGILAMFSLPLLCGLINGLAITRFKMIPFVATLIMMMLSSGAATQLSHSVSTPAPEVIVAIGKTTFIGIPVAIWIMLVVGVILHILLKKTAFGRVLFAIGTNSDAVTSCGIPTNRYLVLAYLLSSLMSALAAFVLIARLGASSLSLASDSASLDVICSAILGGASIYGGAGSILGAFLGTLALQTLQNVMNLFGVDYFVMIILKGVLILFITYFDTIRTRLRGKA